MNVSRCTTTLMGVMLSIGFSVALASMPASNELGARFKVIRSGTTTTVEIRMSPKRNFDSVSVEAGSGVATLTPACKFSNLAVVAGGTYVCRVNVTGKPTDAAMTLNVIAQRMVPGGKVPETEIHHYSVANPAVKPSTKTKTASHHEVKE